MADPNKIDISCEDKEDHDFNEERKEKFKHLEPKFFQFYHVTKVPPSGVKNIAFMCFKTSLAKMTLVLASTAASSTFRRYIMSNSPSLLKDLTQSVRESRKVEALGHMIRVILKSN